MPSIASCASVTPSPSASGNTNKSTASVAASLEQEYAFATTEIVPLVEPTTTEIVLVFELPDQPLGKVQV